MRSEIASGAGWMLLFRLIDRALGLVSTVILARLLVPQDFGLVAMALSVIGVIEMATWMSFDVALIQRDKLHRVHYDTAWTLNAALGLASGAAIALLAYPTALFYDEPRLTPPMVLLALGWAAAGFENIGIVDFRRHLDFRREFKFMFARRVAGFTLTVVLALALQTYWALVIGTVASKLVGVGLSYGMHPYRPRFSLAAARELLAFSSWVLSTNILNALRLKVSHFVVGRYLGASPLGALTIGTEIAMIPSSDLIAPINRAVFPGYSRMAQDPDVLRALFLDVVGVIMFIAVPAAVGLAAVADPLVRTMLGEKWIEAVPVIQVLSISGAILAATSNNTLAFLAIGKPGLITLLSMLRLTLLVPLAILLTNTHGLVGAAFAELATSMFLMVASLPILFSKLQLPYSGYFSRTWRPIVASAVMAFCVVEALGAMPGQTFPESALALGVGLAVGVVVYPAAIVALWMLSGRPEGAEAILYRRIQAAAGKRSSRA